MNTTQTCGTPMRHANESVSPCILPKNHQVTDEDSDHRDVHGCTAHVLVKQAALREIAAVTEQPYRPVKLQRAIPDNWMSALLNPPEQDPNNRTADWRKLYDWLATQAYELDKEAQDNELAANLDQSAGPAYMADAMREVRKQMRKMDPSLPTRRQQQSKKG